MPTFSSNYQIKLIGTGEEAGTWGTSTNQNLERIEQALGESVSIDVTSIADYSAGSPSTATWLTSDTADAGASLSEGRAGFVEFTSGSDVGASGVIVRVRGNDSSIYPNRIFLVKNSLSDSRDLKLNSNSTDATNIVTIANGCHALVYTDGTHARNALSKLQVDDIQFPAAAEIFLPANTASALEIRGPSGNEEFIRFDTANNHLELAPGSGINNIEVDSSTVQLNSATIDISNQNTDLSLRNNQTEAFEIFEGTNSYLKFDTSGKKIVVGDNPSDVGTLDISTSNIRLADQATDIRVNADSSTSLTVSDSNGTILTVDTLSEPEKIITSSTSELEVLGTLDVDGTSDFSATATFSSVDINGGAIDGTNIGAASTGTGRFSSLESTGTTNGLHLSSSDAYANFGATSGSGGYGIRDSSGKLEIKKSGGSWNDLGPIFISSAFGTPTNLPTGTENKKGVIDIGPFRLIIDSVLLGGTSLNTIEFGSSGGLNNSEDFASEIYAVWAVSNTHGGGFYNQVGASVKTSTGSPRAIYVSNASGNGTYATYFALGDSGY